MVLELYIVTFLDTDGYAKIAKYFAAQSYTNAISRACVLTKHGNHSGFFLELADLELHQRFGFSERQEVKWTKAREIEIDLYSPKHLLKT